MAEYQGQGDQQDQGLVEVPPPSNWELNQAIGSAIYNSQKMKEVERLMSVDGTDLNHPDCTHSTPLSTCILRGGVKEPRENHRVDLMLLLLKHEADPNWKDCQGWSLLHQAACSGDITFIKTCVRNGKGDTRSLNQDNQYPVDLAALRGHTSVMEYLDAHSGDLKSVCRGVIRKALGVRIHHLNKLPLPPRVKLFLNFNIPYLGFSAVLVPPEPWTPEQLHRREVGAQELHTFIEETASEEFLEEHEDVLFGKESERLVELFQEMYLWESFKKVEFEEPLPRKPRYSLVKLEKSKNKKIANFFF